mgnify:CR=1 FL=1
MGFFDKIKQGLTKTKTKMDAQLTGIFAAYAPGDEEFFEDLEETLILADTGVETTTKAIAQLRKAIELKKLTTGAEVKKEFVQILTRILKVQDTMLLLTTQPSVVLVVGVNGVGKTTTIGKLASQLKKEGNRVLLSAADTFRAAAADQLTVWAQRAGVEIVKHEEGSDPAAVVFDSIQAAKARGVDVVIVDTAGRLHNKANLMNELNKITRVIRRELPEADIETLMVLDATTGQNGLIQAKQFLDTADLTGIVLTKLDGTAKGGIVFAIANDLQLPVKYVGVGEQIVQACGICGGAAVMILASNNAHKLDEFRAIFADMGIEIIPQSAAGCDFEVDETGETFEENAYLKAIAVTRATGQAAIADDSGLEDGAPGVHSARYTGRHDDTDAARNELLLHNLGARTDRTARFVSCICCTFPNGDVLRARGTCEGSILFAPRGENGFGYDPLFLPEGYDCSMAELRPEEKNAISHRGNALKILKEELRNYYADK